MDSTLLLLLGLTCVGVILGVLIGRLTARVEQSKLVSDAFERGKAESEVEKANLAIEIGDQMLKLRSGIQDLARAYEGTARIVRERLLGSVDGTINVPSETQLSLNFHSGELHTGGASPFADDELVGHGQGIEEHGFEEPNGESVAEQLEIESIHSSRLDDKLSGSELVSPGIDDERILEDESRLKEKFVSNLM